MLNIYLKSLKNLNQRLDLDYAKFLGVNFEFLTNHFIIIYVLCSKLLLDIITIDIRALQTCVVYVPVKSKVSLFFIKLKPFFHIQNCEKAFFDVKLYLLSREMPKKHKQMLSFPVQNMKI